MMHLIRTYVVVLIIIASLLAGCSKRGKDSNIDPHNMSTEALFPEDAGYPYLAQLLNGMSQQDLWIFATLVVENLDAAVKAGQASEEDAKAGQIFATRLHDWMETSSMTDLNDVLHGPFVELLDIMVRNNLGSVISSLVSAAGPDFLTTNVYPLLAYVIQFDTAYLEKAVSGITISDFTMDISQIEVEDFQKAANALHGAFTVTQENGKYHDIYIAAMALYEDIKANDTVSSFTFGDVKDLFDVDVPILDLELGDAALYAELIDVLWDMFNNDSKIKEDISAFLHAGGFWASTLRTGDPYHDSWKLKPDESWDSESNNMTDLEHVLLCARDILRPDSASGNSRANLKKFVKQALEAVKYLDGADNMYGITNALASINPKTDYINDLCEYDNIVYECFMMNNMNRKPTASDSIKASFMQSTILLFDEACKVSDGLVGWHPDFTPWLLSVALGLDRKFPDDVPDDNILDWLATLVSKTLGDYDTTYAYEITSLTGSSAGRPYPDPIVGVDWINYEAYVGLLHLLPFNGLSRLINALKDIDLIDLVTMLVSEFGISEMINLGDLSCFTESLAVWDTLLGCTGDQHTSGDYHRLLTFVAPLLKHYVDMGYASELFHVVGDLNEIDLQDYTSLIFGASATYRQTSWNTALETMQGPYGYGALYYLLRGESTENNNEDLADPALDLLVRVLYKLRNTSYENTNLLRAICDDVMNRGTDVAGQLSDQTDYTVDELIEDLFANDGPIDYLYQFLAENHSQVALIFEELGYVLMDMVNPEDPSRNILYIEDVTSLLEFLRDLFQGANGQIALGTVLTKNAEAISQIVVNVMEQAGIDDQKMLDDAAGLAAIVCNRGEDLFHDLGYAMPVLVQLWNSFSINISYGGELATDNLEPLWDYLTADIDGRENPFMFNLKTLLFKVCGIYDETYNASPNAAFLVLNDTTSLVDILEHLIGEKDGLYDIMPVIDFLAEVTSDEGSVLIDLIDVGEQAVFESTSGDTLWGLVTDFIFSTDSECNVSLGFIKSLFVPYCENDPFVLAFLKFIKLEYQGSVIDFDGVLNDINNFIKNNEFQKGSHIFDWVYQISVIIIERYYP